MKSLIIAALTILSCALASVTYGQAGQPTLPFIRHNFEENTHGWTAISQNQTGSVKITHDADSVKEGKGALQFDYKIEKGNFNLIYSPIEVGRLSKARAFRFWVKADHATAMGFSLNEKDGGRYTAVFTVPKDKWQNVELAPSDFVLGEGKDDPKDPDNKLDMDQVESLWLADLSQIFVQGDAAGASLFNVKPGAHKLFLDELLISTEQIPQAISVLDGVTALDTFSRPQVAWIVMGEMQVVRMTGKPLEGAGIEVKYHQAPGTVLAFMKALPKNRISGAKKLHITIASLNEARLTIQIEQKMGVKFNADLKVMGESNSKDYTISISDFMPAPDTSDANAVLDLSQVTQLLLIDSTGLQKNAESDNTLWFNNLRVSQK